MSKSSTTLNSDILLSILSISTMKAATSIMETCRFLYHEGAKIVLQQPIFTDPVSEAAAKILLEIVPRMSNLVRLSISAEQSFMAYPYLVPAFASLRSIKFLVAINVGAQSCEMVRALQSELVTANIIYPAGRCGEPSQFFVPSRHPLQLLQRSASTLQELMCALWSDGYILSRTPEALLAPPAAIYPEVHTLLLRDSRGPSLIPYIQALPNLTRLLADSHHTLIGELARLTIAHANWQLNLMLQTPTLNHQGERLPDFDEADSFAWKHIQSYHGPLADLWALGTTFHIPQLTVSDVPGIRSPLALTEVLAYARPAHLMILFEDQQFTSVLESDFLGVLQSEGASGLRSLRMMFDLMAGDVDENIDVGRALLTDISLVLRDITPPEDVAPAPIPIPNGEGPARMHDSELAHATLDMSSAGEMVPSAPSTLAVPAETLASFTLVERTLEEFDVRDFVHRLSTSIPSIQHVMVAIGRPTRTQCGGLFRSACLGKSDDKDSEESHMRVYTGGKIL
ncbi:hypothetical protein V8D89_002889 [Ganoderma adspersum]